MKKLVLFYSCLVMTAHAVAQVNVAGSNAPVKLSDVIANYQKLHPGYGKKESVVLKSILPGLPKEENAADYQFGRWLWYWKQHTDGNGYLVSPAKTWQEWQKAQSQQKSSGGHKGAARTTAGTPAAWAFVGPDSSEADGEGVGRINVVAFHPTDSNTFWIGSPGGGAWKTSNHGMSWTSMTDQLPLLSIADIVFNPLNPNTVYLCTGDRDAGDYSGIGVLKSYDGGNTWNTTGMTWAPDMYNIANSMVINPLDTNSLVLATTVGIYRSYDGGATFTSVNTGNFYQVLYCPTDTTIVYATSYINYNTTPYTYAQIWRSPDGGTTWTQQTNFTTTDRVTIAVSPAAPDMVMGVGSTAYSSGGSNSEGLDGVYKSSDYGNTYAYVYTGGCSGNLLTWDAGGSGCGGQGWYTLPLAISPIDSNTVFTGGVNSWSSSDGGLSWVIANQWSQQISGVATVHADKHWMAFNPLTPTTFYETNDGGVYSSSTPNATGVWNDYTNRMGIEEIYRTSVSNIASFAITGAQDVGSKLEFPGYVYEEACGGDGMACLLDFADSTVAYASSETGYFSILDPTNPFPINTATGISGSLPQGSGGWVTPIAIEPSCHSCILIGYASVWESPDEGTTWNNISPSLTTGDLYRVVTTSGDPNTIFATEDAYSQNIYYTHDGGTTWTTLTAPYAGNQYISDLKIDPSNADHIWVTFSGYGSPEVAQWNSSTGWQLMTTGLPDVPVMCFAVDYLSRDLYVGTEIGVYYRDSTMTSWAPYTTGMPSVEVTDIEINYTTNELWAATYGRSLWKSPKNTATILPLSVASIAPFVPDGVTISPNPNHGNFIVTVKNITDKQVNLQLIDDNGKAVWQGNGTLQGSKMNVNIQGLVAGNYILQISSGNTIEGKQKMVVY